MLNFFSASLIFDDPSILKRVQDDDYGLWTLLKREKRFKKPEHPNSSLGFLPASHEEGACLQTSSLTFLFNFVGVRWFARRPPGMTLTAGDVVQLRAGAEEDSKAVTPLAEILGPAARPAGLAAATRVRCN